MSNLNVYYFDQGTEKYTKYTINLSELLIDTNKTPKIYRNTNFRYTRTTKILMK